LFTDYKTSTTAVELDRTRDLFLATLRSDFVVSQVIEELDLGMEVPELLKQVTIEPDETGTFTLIRVTASDPKLAADIANTLLDKASQYFGEVGASSLTANRLFIQQELGATRKELDEARAALIQFQIENRLSSLEEVLESQGGLINNLKLKRDEALAQGQDERVAGYDQVIAERERELQGLILLISEYDLLRENIGRVEAVYSTLSSKATEAALKENEIFSATFAQVLPAREPSRPLPLVNPKIMVLAGVVSLALGIMLAFLLQAIEHADMEGDQDSVSALQEIVAESRS
jgi:uncharacterized protein involved in exopolysaccharide biosynthesis